MIQSRLFYATGIEYRFSVNNGRVWTNIIYPEVLDFLIMEKDGDGVFKLVNTDGLSSYPEIVKNCERFTSRLPIAGSKPDPIKDGNTGHKLTFKKGKPVRSKKVKNKAKFDLSR